MTKIKETIKTIGRGSFNNPSTMLRAGLRTDSHQQPKKNKIKYTYPGYAANVRDKPALSIGCLDCAETFEHVL